MKKFLISLLLITIISPSSGEVFSNQDLYNISEKVFNENILKNDDKHEVVKKIFLEEKKEEKKVIKNKKIFKNIPNSNKKIINIFLERFENKGYFSHLKKISYRKNSLNRGLASATKIYFNFDKIDTNEEFKRVMIHEMGHIFDLGYLVSKENKIVSNFKDGTKKIYADDPSVEFYSLCFADESTKNGKCSDLDFSSKYGKTDPFEDFAESFLLYIENNKSFEMMAKNSEIMQKKYNFFKKYFGKIDSGEYFGYEKGKRVRDLTLAY